jgi:hypothetical protein
LAWARDSSVAFRSPIGGNCTPRIRWSGRSYRPDGNPCNNNFVWIEHPNGEWTKYTLMLRRTGLGGLLAEGRLDGLDWLRLTLATTTGGVSSGFVINRRLIKAWRDDLADVLSPTGRELARTAPAELSRRVPKPHLLFNYERLLDCFVNDLIPTQMLTGASDRPFAFSPLTLTYLGSAD